MKKLLLILILFYSALCSQAQFTKATLQATGLTCAMCSNAINKALEKVSFVDNIKADIKNSSFAIVFKNNSQINVDALKEAVEDAGFSVGSLKLTGNFSDTKIEKDQHITIGNEIFHFLNGANQVLQGELTITVVDKNFVTVKQFKKYITASKISCFQTGKAANCSVKDGVADGERVYHVTM